MTTKDFPANLVPSSIQFGLQSNTQVFKAHYLPVHKL